MKRLRLREAVVLASVVCVSVGTVHAGVISEDFEALSGDVLPSGWTLADNNGGLAGPVYTNVTPGAYGTSNVAAWLGPNNLVGVGVGIPGGWFQTPTADVFSGSAAFAGSLDLRFDSSSSPDDDAVLLLGDLDAKDFYWVIFCEVAATCEMWRTDDNFNRTQVASSFVSSGLIGNTWYHVNFAWAPTAGNVGDFSLEVWDATTKKGELNVGLTMDDDVYFGFGSSNDMGRFDNISIIPEPGALVLLGLGSLAAVRRRRG